MDAALVAKLLAPPFKPFDLILVSRDEYHVADPKHCRVREDHILFVWSQGGDIEVIDLRLVERVRIHDILGFGEFEKLVNR